jgi:hypothetical protein
LQDPDTEKILKFSLENCIAKAKSKPVLKLWKIYIDKNGLEDSDYTYNDLKSKLENVCFFERI